MSRNGFSRFGAIAGAHQALCGTQSESLEETGSWDAAPTGSHSGVEETHLEYQARRAKSYEYIEPGDRNKVVMSDHCGKRSALTDTPSGYLSDPGW